jgi:hypothetical protein
MDYPDNSCSFLPGFFNHRPWFVKEYAIQIIRLAIAMAVVGTPKAVRANQPKPIQSLPTEKAFMAGATISTVPSLELQNGPSKNYFRQRRAQKSPDRPIAGPSIKCETVRHTDLSGIETVRLPDLNGPVHELNGPAPGLLTVRHTDPFSRRKLQFSDLLTVMNRNEP